MKPKKRIKPQQKQSEQTVPLHIFKPNIWFAVIAAMVGFCLYINTVKHDYVLDDTIVITDNEYVLEGISGIPKILKTEMSHFTNINLGYYRPLSMITFAVENQFFPKNPHVSHLGNLILYALTGFFLCMLLMNLFRNFHPFFSFIVTLLFIAHPIHTEVVANIKSRDEILAFLNLILAIFILLHAYKHQNINYKLIFLSCIFFYLALLSKETAMTGLLIVPLVLFFSYPFTIKQSLFRVIPFLLMILIFLVQKYIVLGTVTGVIQNDIVNYPYALAGTKLPSTFLIFMHYLRLIIFPHPLTYDYSYNQIPAASVGSPLAVFGFFIAITLIYFSFKGLLKKSMLAFGVLIFCLTLASALAFVFLRGGILAERFLYAPSLGFSIVITFLLIKFSKTNIQSSELKIISLLKEIKFILPVSILFMLYSFKTVTRNSVWRDNITLYSKDVKTSPNSCQVRRHYGTELINNGIYEKDAQKRIEWFDKGTEQLKVALKINPYWGEAFFQLGIAYQMLEMNNDSASYYYIRTIEVSPMNTRSYNNLGILYQGLGKQELASYYYNKAVEVNPYFSLGVQNRDSHRKKTGLDVHSFPTSLNQDSTVNFIPEGKHDFTFYFSLGTNYAMKGDYANAAKYLEKAIEMNPNVIEPLINLSNCYALLKNYQKNIETLNKVIAINPNNTQALGNLATTYELIGNKDKAEEYRDKIRKLTIQ